MYKFHMPATCILQKPWIKASKHPCLVRKRSLVIEFTVRPHNVLAEGRGTHGSGGEEGAAATALPRDRGASSRWHRVALGDRWDLLLSWAGGATEPPLLLTCWHTCIIITSNRKNYSKADILTAGLMAMDAALTSEITQQIRKQGKKAEFLLIWPVSDA